MNEEGVPQVDTQNEGVWVDPIDLICPVAHLYGRVQVLVDVDHGAVNGVCSARALIDDQVCGWSNRAIIWCCVGSDAYTATKHCQQVLALVHEQLVQFVPLTNIQGMVCAPDF